MSIVAPGLVFLAVLAEPGSLPAFEDATFQPLAAYSEPFWQYEWEQEIYFGEDPFGIALLTSEPPPESPALHTTGRFRVIERPLPEPIILPSLSMARLPVGDRPIAGLRCSRIYAFCSLRI